MLLEFARLDDRKPTAKTDLFAPADEWAKTAANNIARGRIRSASWKAQAPRVDAPKAGKAPANQPARFWFRNFGTLHKKLER
jgi:hypothetical protein